MCQEVNAIVARNVTLSAGAILVVALAHAATALMVAAQAGSPGPGNTFPPSAAAITPGYTVDPQGEVVTDVVPGGPAWVAGFRPGWRLNPEYSAELGEPGAVAACRGEICRTYTDAQGIAALAGRWSFEVAAAILSVVGLVLLRRRASLAGLLGLAAIALSVPTWATTGNLTVFPPLYLATLLAPPVWLALVDQRRAWRVLLAVSVAVSAAWLVSRLAMPGIYDAFESARVSLITVAVVAGVVVLADWLSLVDTRAGRERKLDAAVVTAIAGWALASWWFGLVPEAFAVGGAASLTVAYFALRHRIRRLFLRVASAERRQRVTLEALEEERSRVARDIHDVPLQEISAVIRQLGLRRDAQQELEQLREVAQHLREVSVSLRPPVLDDVGLGAALAELLSRQPVDSTARVEVNLDDRTTIDHSTRPPLEVELAVYRIVQEAVANAHRHAGATRVIVSGLIGREELRVTVADDGRGIDQREATQSEREGRLGLASMRERAKAIHASLLVGSEPGGGTVVSVAWTGT